LAYNAASDIVATTNEFWIPSRIPDLIGETSPLLALLFSRGNTDADGKPAPSTKGQMIEGGNKIKRTLRFARNESRVSYSGFDTLPTVQTRLFDHVSYEWRKYAGAIPFSLDQELENRGPEAVHNLLQGYLDGAMADMMHDIATGIYNSAATRTGTQQIKGINGLRELCITDRTWGNIDSTTYTWWDPGHYSATAYTAANLADPTHDNYIVKMIRTGVDNCRHAGRNVTHIFTTNALYNLIEDTMLHNRIVTNSEIKRSTIGYKYLDFRGIEIIADETYCPDFHMFFLNLDTYAGEPILGLKGRKDAFFRLTSDREISNQLASVKYLIAHVCLYCDQPRLFGMYTDLAQT
jgi:hypothetical protein